MSEPIVIETVVDEQLHQINPIGIENEKTYKVIGTYGANNTTFEFTATTMQDGTLSFLANTDLIGDILICTIIEGEEDGGTMCGVMLGVNDSDDADIIGGIFSPFVINSITEVA